MLFLLTMATCATTVRLGEASGPQSQDLRELLRLALEARDLEVVDSGPGDITVSIKTAEAMGLVYITASYALGAGDEASARYGFPGENPGAIKDIVEDIASSAALFAASGRFMGSLVVISEPPGARVYVNGKKQGLTPLTIRGFELAKPYSLTLVMAGYERVSRQINLTDITPDTLRLGLTSAKQTSQDTVVYSSAGWATVTNVMGALGGCLFLAGLYMLLSLVR